MTPTPWLNAVTHILSNGAPVTVCSFGSDNKNWESDRAAIVSAINCTYGAGINPEAVPELLACLLSIVNSDFWKKEFGGGSVDKACERAINNAKL